MGKPENIVELSIPAGPVVLVADDDELFRKPLVKALRFFGQRAGYKVIEACNGDELYKIAEQLIIRGGSFVIIVDNQMPVSTGDAERQWNGFERILALCDNYRLLNLGEHVLFLSRWDLQDLPDDMRLRGEEYMLLEQSNWWSLYTPFSILKIHIERMLA